MPVEVIAHRGASGTCPENTLAAFRRAEAVGAHMIELDVQLSRDGEVVVMHDDTLERTTDGHGPVARWTLAEMQRLDAGSWFGPEFAGERVPTLGEVLAAIRLPINVELKPGGGEGLEARALEVVRAAGALERIVFSSFDPDALHRLRGLTADAQLGVLWARSTLSPAIALAKRVAARGLHLRKTLASPEHLAAAREAGLLTRVWTVNEPREFARLKRAGVDGVFTDYPERFLLL
ncbi:MAG TPA: glycerophosphodiester phosphodiesterase family protein [Candidatus Limnocylindria bacterium]|nr:glycerophosphodiester phosphodiesterase family protein [Candidatus Limnocylindria bacterium]